MTNVWLNKKLWPSLGFVGGTVGAAGWILGAAQELASGGHATDATLVLLCAAGVLLTGGMMWSLWLAGNRLDLFVLVETLLGSSLVFGILSLWIMHARGVFAFAVDSSGVYSEWFAYAAPVFVFALMAVLCYPGIRRWLRRKQP